MRKIREYLIILSFALPLFFSGCTTTGKVYIFTPADALTDREKEGIIAHIRQFVERAQYQKLDLKANAKHYKGLRLSPAERKFIRNAPPLVKIHYTGKKAGELTVRWNFPNHRNLIVQRKGYLLSTGKNDWNVRIMTDHATGSIPKLYFGSKGEDIRRLSPEMEKALRELPPSANIR